VKLGMRSRCALRMMWEISRLGGENGPVSLSAVSRRCHISRNSLAPLALALRNRGLLKGVRGSRGGYRLGRPSREIALGEIVEASAGPLNIVECVENPAACLCSDYCDCRLTYALLNRRIKEVLNSVTLGEMQDPAWLPPRKAIRAVPACVEALRA
jgi:Rrf2 family protein